MDDPIRQIEQLRRLRCRRRPDLAIDGVIAETRRRSEERQRRLGELISVWNAVVPHDLAQQATIDGLRRGVLHVSVGSSPASYALDRAMREGLLDELRSRFGATLLRVKIGLHRQ